MNFLRKGRFIGVCGSRYIEIWVVAVVQPVRMDSRAAARIMELAEPTVVINLLYLIGFPICPSPMVRNLLTAWRCVSRIVEKNFTEIQKT